MECYIFHARPITTILPKELQSTVAIAASISRYSYVAFHNGEVFQDIDTKTI